MGHIGHITNRCRVNREVMILARNFNFAGRGINDRMISPVMTKRQLDNRGTNGKRQDLMPETNPEQGNLPHKNLYRIDGIGDLSRITRPVGQKHAVWLAI